MYWDGEFVVVIVIVYLNLLFMLDIVVRVILVVELG